MRRKTLFSDATEMLGCDLQERCEFLDQYLSDDFRIWRGKGSEGVVGFSLPGDIASGFSDRMYRNPSRLAIIASCRMEVLQLPFGYAFSKISEQDRHFTLKMGKAFSRTLFERHLNLYKLTASERYRRFYVIVLECLMVYCRLYINGLMQSSL